MKEGLFNHDIEWKPYKKELNFDQNSVHIFKVSIDKHDYIKNLYTEALSEKERAKATRYINKKDTERYIVSKYCLRNILSAFILTPPSQVQFRQSPKKKPIIDGIEFNVTHSGNYILIAVSPTPIGIDIEMKNKDFDFESILATCFNGNEKSFINNSSDRLLIFYGLWTRKESILKASGEGLTDNLDQICSLDDFAIRQQVKYKLKSFLIDDDYIMSLAFDSKTDQLNYWDYH